MSQSSFAAMRYQSGCLSLVDQRLLPEQEVWVNCHDLESVARSIEQMVVRGAPAIGCVAAFGLALDAFGHVGSSWSVYKPKFLAALERLSVTRPTAVNLFYALDCMGKVADGFLPDTPGDVVCREILLCAEQMFREDLETCQTIGRNGASLNRQNKRLRLLTHCNTGSLATAGYGTALGVIRALHEKNCLEMVYVDETRPWWQGARLTAFELEKEGIPYTVIVDSAAAWVMKVKKIDWVIVGADRIAANGDTANKIGTYHLALAAKHHQVPLYIAAPRSTIDLSTASGVEIPVEERSPDEVRSVRGLAMTPQGAGVFNPSFDVTPADLISGIITELGVITPPYASEIRKACHLVP